MRIYFDIENPFKNLTKDWTTSPMKIVIIITAAMFGVAGLFLWLTASPLF